MIFGPAASNVLIAFRRPLINGDHCTKKNERSKNNYTLQTEPKQTNSHSQLTLILFLIRSPLSHGFA